MIIYDLTQILKLIDVSLLFVRNLFARPSETGTNRAKVHFQEIMSAFHTLITQYFSLKGYINRKCFFSYFPIMKDRRHKEVFKATSFLCFVDIHRVLLSVVVDVQGSLVN